MLPAERGMVYDPAYQNPCRFEVYRSRHYRLLFRIAPFFFNRAIHGPG